MNDGSTESFLSSNVYGPLTAGEMFRRSFQLIGETPGLFFGIAAVLLGVEIVVGGVAGLSGLGLGRMGLRAAPAAQLLVTVPLGLLTGVIVIVLTQIVQGGFFVATRARLQGLPMTVGDACRTAAERVGRLVGVSLLIMLRMYGYLLLVAFAFSLTLITFALITKAILPSASGSFGTGHGMGPAHAVWLIGAGLSFVAVLVMAMFWLYARYAVAIPATIEEDVSVTAAIRRSVELSRGSKGRIYALLLTAFVAYAGLVACVLPVELMMVHRAGSMTTHLAMPSGGMMLFSLVQNLWSAVVLTFFGVAVSLCYFDLRVRKEGFGGAQAVGTSAPLVLPDEGENLQGLQDDPVGGGA